MEKQFTATVYIVDKDKVLLIYHKKMCKWLPPGGHIDPNELPSDAAIREAKEETGIDVELILDENIHIQQNNATSFPRPYMCLLEEIPAWNGHAAHQHMDFIYVGKKINGSLKQNPRETNGIRWFTFKELQELVQEVEIYTETFKTIEKLIT
jgi:8-oxo-dGTP pyrophosphatase MutT (NUDIX family)